MHRHFIDFALSRINFDAGLLGSHDFNQSAAIYRDSTGENVPGAIGLRKVQVRMRPGLEPPTRDLDLICQFQKLADRVHNHMTHPHVPVRVLCIVDINRHQRSNPTSGIRGLGGHPLMKVFSLADIAEDAPLAQEQPRSVKLCYTLCLKSKAHAWAGEARSE